MAGWAAYVKTQAGELMQKLGAPSDTIIHADIQKLVLYRHTWGPPTECQSADTAAMMVIVLPSHLKVRLYPTQITYILPSSEDVDDPT